MSTWSKASKVNQKTHRERHQPQHRSHLGLLEKKQDYKQRAANEGKKKQMIKVLKRKALDKNPDEFNFHMVNSKMIDDTHRDFRKPKTHTEEQIKLMKTRDIKYVTMKRTVETKRIDKLKSQLHLIDKLDNISNSHTFFVDTVEEAEKFDVVKHLDTHPDLLQRRYNRPRLSDLEKLDLPDVDKSTSQKIKNQQNKIYTELKKRINREHELAVVQRKLELERYLNSKKETRPIQVKSGTPKSAPIYKWKQERKR